MTILSANGFMRNSLRFPGWLGLFLSGSLLRVIINAPARFAAKASLLHVLAQQRIGTVLFAERSMKIFKNMETHVETHKIHQFKRTHRMIEAQLQGLVDVLRGRDAGFEHVKCLVANERVDARGDESRSFIDDDNFFSHAAGDFAASGNGFVGSMRRPDKLNKLHFRDRIEKVHADAAIARNRDVRKICDRKRRSIAGKNSAGFRELVENSEELEFHLQFFRNRFDDEVRVAYGVLDVTRSGDQ